MLGVHAVRVLTVGLRVDFVGVDVTRVGIDATSVIAMIVLRTMTQFFQQKFFVFYYKNDLCALPKKFENRVSPYLTIPFWMNSMPLPPRAKRNDGAYGFIIQTILHE